LGFDVPSIRGLRKCGGSKCRRANAAGVFFLFLFRLIFLNSPPQEED
jgi:hypothetical protein